VMIGAMAREVAHRRADALALLFRQPRGEVERIRDAEPEQPAVEVLAALGIGDVDAEVAESPDAERPWQLHAADIEFTRHAHVP